MHTKLWRYLTVFILTLVSASSPVLSRTLPIQLSAATESLAEHQITLTESGFTPQSITINVGETVSWLNETPESHTLTSGEPYRIYLPLILRAPIGSVTASATSSSSEISNDVTFGGTLTPGGSYDFTFETAGTYLYYLRTAPQHTGIIAVEATTPVAPALDETVVTTMISATTFLYTGDDPLQTGVTPGTLEAERVAVLRGKVSERDGSPLPDVTITVHGHPEFGQTLTRADGAFDMAVNGGGQLIVQYEKTGYLSVQRHVQVAWQDYVWLPDVVLISRDATVTPVEMESAELQVAQGSVVSDADGSRQATVLIPAGTGAEVVLEDGGTQPVNTLHIRATEFTVGDAGPAAMPAELPAVTGYTYAVELTADEVEARVDGQEVVFDQPILFYLENFLELPTGTNVPMGYYNDDAGAWVPSDNGRVIEILSINGGMAQLDTDGDGAADNGMALTPTMTTAERSQLGETYTVGEQLWRIPITHFSDWDANLGVGPPDDAAAPEIQKSWQDYLSSPLCLIGLCDLFGSVVGAQNQTLGEAVDVTATPFSLHYASDRTPGFQAAYTLNVPVSKASVPASLKRIELEIEVAGRRFTETLPATPNQVYRFQWDGRDAYGRRVQGAHPVKVRLGYVYDGYYQEPAEIERSFGYRGDGVALSYDPARQEFILWQRMMAQLGTWDARGFGLGSWSLDVHHAYDPVGKVLYLGDGRRHQGAALSHAIDTVAGGGDDPACATCPADELEMDRPHGLALAPDGTLYIADTYKNRVRALQPDGSVKTLTALNDQLKQPMDVALAPDGALYVADTGTQYEPGHNRILRVAQDGAFIVVAGTGSPGYNGDGIPAATAQLNTPAGVAVGPDGSLYVSDTGNHRIRQITPDGVIQTVAGTGSAGYSGDDGPATQAQINTPWGLTVAEDGTLAFADHNNTCVRQVSVDGIISTVGPVFNLYTNDVAQDDDGSLYVTLGGASLFDDYQVHRIAPDGSVTVVAGDGTAGFSGDGGPATAAQLAAWTYGVVPGLENNLYLADNDRIREVSQPLPGFESTELAIPSADGRLLYQFDAFGRHLRTLNSLTATPIYTFTYNTQGWLMTIEDGDGDQTTIERTAGVTPTAVVAPFGQRTELDVNGDGYLKAVSDPLGDTYAFTYRAGGLLETLTDPRQSVHRYRYAADGRLTDDENPAGGHLALTRLTDNAAYTVSVGSAEDLTTTYAVGFLESGEQLRINIFPDGTQNQARLGTDAGTTLTYPHDLQYHERLEADPRFKMQAPLLAEQIIETPEGRTYQLNAAREAALSPSGDPPDLTILTDTVTVNGRTYRSVYDTATRTWTQRSPEGRETLTELDPLGRPLEMIIADLQPFTYTYDDHGRPEQVAQGSRQMAFTYAPVSGYLKDSADALGNTTTYVRDATGRLISRVQPDGSSWGYAWDGNDNLTTLTEPDGSTQHVFTYTLDDRLGLYRSPLGSEEHFSYDRDGRLVRRELPSTDAIEWHYNDQGQLATTHTPEGDHTFDYGAVTGLLTHARSRDAQHVDYDYDGHLPIEADWRGLVTDTVRYAYDDDLRTSQIDYAGTSLPISYDDDGLLTGVGAIALSRDADHGLLRGVAEGAFNVTYNYNDFGEINAVTAAYGAILYHTTYTHDVLGRINQKVESIDGSTHTWTYDYDDVGQLSQVRRDGSLVEDYAYDAVGNRIAMDNTLIGVTVPNGGYSYAADHKLLTAGSTSYTYDADGRLRTVVDGGTTTYIYNTDGTLASVQTGGQTITYQYNAQGRRVTRSVDGVRTHAWLYGAGTLPLAEYDGSGALRSVFIYAGGATPVKMIRSGATYHVVSDHLGSPRLVVNGSGNIVKRIDYDAFGNVIADTYPGFDLPFGFAGGLIDPAHTLVRFGARDYQPSTGRWTGKDPILFGGGYHVYGYVGNDPLNRVDRRGLQDCFESPGGPVCVVTEQTYTEPWEEPETIDGVNGAYQPHGAASFTVDGVELTLTAADVTNLNVCVRAVGGTESNRLPYDASALRRTEQELKQRYQFDPATLKRWGFSTTSVEEKNGQAPWWQFWKW